MTAERLAQELAARIRSVLDVSDEYGRVVVSFKREDWLSVITFLRSHGEQAGQLSPVHRGELPLSQSVVTGGAWEQAGQSPSDTPRTDAFEKSCVASSVIRDMKNNGERIGLVEREFVISLGHARQLERELAVALMDARDMKAAWDAACNDIAALTRPPERPSTPARQLAALQAEDEALWFKAETAPEAYLQQALRALHAAVERPDADHERFAYETVLLTIMEECDIRDVPYGDLPGILKARGERPDAQAVTLPEGWEARDETDTDYISIKAPGGFWYPIYKNPVPDEALFDTFVRAVLSARGRE